VIAVLSMRFQTKLRVEIYRRKALKLIMYSLFVFMFVHAIHTQLASARTMFFENQPVEEEIVEPVAGTVDNSDKGIIQRVANEEGIDWKILWGLYIKETQGDCTRIGDLHFVRESVGCYQINKYFHPHISYEQATDLEWSSRWVSERLKRYAEKGGWDYAVAKHNGNPANPQVQAYLSHVKEIMATL